MATIPEALAMAVRHHRAGRLQHAERIYKQVLQADPNNAAALNYLGMIASQKGDHAGGAEWIGRAVRSSPHNAALHHNLGVVYRAMGRLEEAETSHRRAVQIRGDYLEAHTHLGSVLRAQGRLDEAVAAFRRALAIRDDSVSAHHGLALALADQGKLDEAVASYRRTLELEPSFAEAHNNLGAALERQGKLEEAAACYRRAVEINPAFAGGHHNLASVLKTLGRLDEAVASGRRAVEMQGDFAQAHLTLGVILAQQDRLDEAASAYGRAIQLRPDLAKAHHGLGDVFHARERFDEAESSYRRALTLDPDLAETHNNLGVTLQARGDLKAAEACYRRAAELKDDFAEAYRNLGTVFTNRRAFEAAEACYRQALDIRDDFAEVHDLLGGALKSQGKIDQAAASYRQVLRLRPEEPLRELRIITLCPCVFRDSRQIDAYRAKLLADLRRFAERDLPIDLLAAAAVCSEPPFGLQYHGRDDRPIKEAHFDIFRKSVPREPPPGGGSRPRIGFVVTKGHEPAFLTFLGGIVERLAGDRLEPVIVCASTGVSRIRGQIPDESIRVVALSDRFDRMVDAIRGGGFDLLHYWEIGTDATNYFLPLCRPAPVQSTSWGIAVTSGIPLVDYYVSSALLEPAAAEEHYTEELVRLETLPTYYRRPPRQAAARTRGHFGLADGRHLYLCPQSLLKIHPDFDVAIAGILRRDPAGEVVLIAGRQPYWRQRLEERFAATIPDGVDRIRFVPHQRRADFLQLIGLCDVVLDPFHFGGGNTTYEALAAGIPIVTWPSAYMRGRITAACYQKMGVSDCIASDRAAYVDLAVRLATDRDYREAIRAGILSRNDVLFEDTQAVVELERFFLRAATGSGKAPG